MNNHVLVKLAKRKPYSSTPDMPDDAYYDSIKGYWMDKKGALVSSGSEYGARVSKKCDQETGEDQKGE
jgi:hypothetical protein